MSGHVGLETGPHASAVSVRAGDLTPDSANVGLLFGSRCVQLGLATVHIHAPFANVEQSVLPVAASLNLQDGVAFVLVSQTALVSGEDGLGPQASVALLLVGQGGLGGALSLWLVSTGQDSFLGLGLLHTLGSSWGSGGLGGLTGSLLGGWLLCCIGHCGLAGIRRDRLA